MNEGNWGMYMSEFFHSYYCRTLYNNFFLLFKLSEKGGVLGLFKFLVLDGSN
jgi:hypothetical protein